MERINIYTVKQFKEKSGLYDIDSKMVTSPIDAKNVVQAVLQLSNEASEKFGILTLNTKNEIAGVHVISIGSLNASMVHPREVFKAAILNNAASVILFHNHPSGDTTPSEQDTILTKKLVDAGEMLGIEVLDHIIVGDDDFLSMKEKDFM